MPYLFRFLLLVGLFVGPASVRAADPPTEPADIIRTFEKAWVVPKGYMRPLDDAGWKARMTAFQKLATIGENAIPALPNRSRMGNPRLASSRPGHSASRPTRRRSRLSKPR